MVPVTSPLLAPMARAPQRRGNARILLALLVSASMHLWFAGGAPSGAVRMTVPPPVQRLEVRLAPRATASDSVEPGRAGAYLERVAPAPEAERAERAVIRSSPAVEPGGGGRPTPSGSEAAAPAAPVLTDPVYYSARELDVYPMPLAPLHFDYPAHLRAARAGAGVLVRVLLDEAGAVEEATVIAAHPAGPFEEHARAALAAARFTPGRRDGKAVKSQLTVRVGFDSTARAGAPR